MARQWKSSERQRDENRARRAAAVDFAAFAARTFDIAA